MLNREPPSFIYIQLSQCFKPGWIELKAARAARVGALLQPTFKIAGRKAIKYFKMFRCAAVYENRCTNLYFSGWMTPEETQSMGLWDVLGQGEGGVVPYSFKWVSVPVLRLSLTSCQTGPVFFPSPIVLSLRGELDYTNLEVMQPQPLGRASCQCSSFSSLWTALRGSQRQVWCDVALHLFL